MNLLRTLTLFACLTGSVAAQQPDVRVPVGFGPVESAEIFATRIVRGRITMPDVRDLERALERGGGYIEFDVTVREVLKGPPTNFVRVTFYAAPVGHPHGFTPTADDLRLMLGGEHVVMLQQIGQRLFLADRFRNVAIRPPTTEILESMRATVVRHSMYARLVPDDTVPLAREVEAILDDIARDPQSEALGFVRLQAFGVEAVPALVRALDDGRRIHADEVLLVRGGTQVENPYRRVRPERYGDVAFAILHELTQQSLGVDPDHLDNNLRTQGIERWRIFAQYALAEQLAPPRPNATTFNRR